MSDLKREQILEAWEGEDAPLAIEVPAWGGTVYAKRLSAGEVTELGQDEGTVAYFALVRSLVDGEGRRIFADEDVPAIMARPYATIVKLLKAVMDHNGMSEEAAEAMVRDFGLADIEPSSIALPSPSGGVQSKREPVSTPAS